MLHASHPPASRARNKLHDGGPQQFMRCARIEIVARSNSNFCQPVSSSRSPLTKPPCVVQSQTCEVDYIPCLQLEKHRGGLGLSKLRAAQQSMRCTRIKLLRAAIRFVVHDKFRPLDHLSQASQPPLHRAKMHTLRLSVCLSCASGSVCCGGSSKLHELRNNSNCLPQSDEKARW